MTDRRKISTAAAAAAAVQAPVNQSIMLLLYV